MVPENRGGHRIIQHSGGMSGFVSQTIVSLDHRCSMVALTNGDHVPIGAIASQFFEEVLPGAKQPAPQAPGGLRQAGSVQKLEAISSGERGGMAWHRVRVTFEGSSADAVFRQTEDGTLAEFNLYPALV